MYIIIYMYITTIMCVKTTKKNRKTVNLVLIKKSRSRVRLNL